MSVSGEQLERLRKFNEWVCSSGRALSEKPAGLLHGEQFVFADCVSHSLHTATQVSLRAIEFRSGIRFGHLANLAPLASDTEAAGDRRIALSTLDAIRLL